MMKNVFKKIIDGEVPCDKVFENDKILAFKDLYPVAPVHILILPKKEISNLNNLTAEDAPLMGDIMLVAKELAKQFNVEEGWRLLVNNGGGSGQSIPYLHFHLIGGRRLGSMA